MIWPKTKAALWRYTPRGIKVFLKKTTWYDHICRGHVEMNNSLEDVIRALERPEATHAFKRDRFSYCYSQRRGSFIMLVYKVSGRLGWVKTAYMVQNPYVEVEGYNRVWPI